LVFLPRIKKRHTESAEILYISDGSSTGLRGGFANVNKALALLANRAKLGWSWWVVETVEAEYALLIQSSEKDKLARSPDLKSWDSPFRLASSGSE
jgi:hypothetical protein